MTVLEKNKEAFLDKAKAKYGDLFDYSRVVYVNTHTPVLIECKKHNNWFTQLPSSHLKHNGCRQCYNETYTKSQEHFLQKAKEVHGDKYDYSKAKYTGSAKKVTIICKKCGMEFRQSPNNHITQKQGCPYCAKRKSDLLKPPPIPEDTHWKKQRFILRAKAKYGKLYTYNNVVWRDNDWPVSITCPIHGEFLKTPHEFLRPGYHGCIRCSDKKRMSLDEFLEKAKAKHGDKYDYSQVDLHNKQIHIYCKKHHEWFTQEPRNHLRYTGCKGCIRDQIGLTADGFLQAAKAKWGNTYGYSRVKYKNNYTPVIVLCKQHGPFYVTPKEHIRTDRGMLGGCPICTSSSGERITFDYLRTLGIRFDREVKLPGYDYRYDFCIPDIKVLIEVDGPQHYEDVGFQSCSLEEQHAIDIFKDDLARANGYSIYRIDTRDDILAQLKCILRENIKLIRNKRPFRTFLDYANYFRIPANDTLEQHKKYLIKD